MSSNCTLFLLSQIKRRRQKKKMKERKRDNEQTSMAIKTKTACPCVDAECLVLSPKQAVVGKSDVIIFLSRGIIRAEHARRCASKNSRPKTKCGGAVQTRSGTACTVSTLQKKKNDVSNVPMFYSTGLRVQCISARADRELSGRQELSCGRRLWPTNPGGDSM